MWHLLEEPREVQKKQQEVDDSLVMGGEQKLTLRTIQIWIFNFLLGRKVHNHLVCDTTLNEHLRQSLFVQLIPASGLTPWRGKTE